MSSTYTDGFSAFDSYITNDFGVCENCFTRIYEHEPYDQTKLKESLRGVLKSDVQKTHKAETDYQQTYSASASRTTYCSECGSDKSLKLKRPLCKERAVEYGENLYDTISDIDELEVNEQELIDEIRRLKSKRDEQHSGNRIFHRAIENTTTITHSELP